MGGAENRTTTGERDPGFLSGTTPHDLASALSLPAFYHLTKTAAATTGSQLFRAKLLRNVLFCSVCSAINLRPFT
jgi:hypothetical protein